MHAEEQFRFMREFSKGVQVCVTRQLHGRHGALYEKTWFDYRFVWIGNSNYHGMHWGYWDENTKAIAHRGRGP